MMEKLPTFRNARAQLELAKRYEAMGEDERKAWRASSNYEDAHDLREGLVALYRPKQPKNKVAIKR